MTIPPGSVVREEWGMRFADSYGPAHEVARWGYVSREAAMAHVRAWPEPLRPATLMRRWVIVTPAETVDMPPAEAEKPPRAKRAPRVVRVTTVGGVL
jgi:hypothetical protein